MKKPILIQTLGPLLALASSVQAATLSWSSVAPTVDGFDVAFGGIAATQADNVSSGGTNGGDSTYIASNRPNQGQTITTGSDAGQVLTSITVKQVGYGTFTSIDTGWVPFGGQFVLRFGTIAGGVFTVTDSFNVDMVDPNPGNTAGEAGGGQYATITLDGGESIALAPNTEYAFSWDAVGEFGGPYFEADGTSAGGYAGGQAFSTLTGSDTTVTAETGDRAFHVNIVPEPSVALLGGIGLLGLLRRRRA